MTLTAHYLRSRMGRVCVAVTGGSAQEMIEKADSVVRDSPFLEFRLDYLQKPLAAIPPLREFLYERSEVTAVATCRRTIGGGKFSGSPASQLEVLTQAAKAGFHLIDLEIETAESITRTQFEALRAAGAGLILSSHDFEGTRDLDKTFARLKPYNPDFFKIVSTAKNLADNVTMERFLERTSDTANLIGICMGEQGLVSRVLGPRAGSVFTFAAASTGGETGPGQVTVRTLIDTYRVEQIDTATRVYGVAGNPVRHSLSPVMMNSAFRRETVNGVYLPLETKRLSDLLKLLDEIPIQGLSVTMPLKQEIMPHLARTDALSEKIGACNTVVRSQDGRLFGFNTDVGGIIRPLERRLALKGAKVLVLGAGGAARAAVFGLVEKGAEVSILNRTVETAQKLARQAKAKTIKREQVAKTSFDVIVNTTPAGMLGQKLQTILNPDELNARLVFDTVYNPIDTPLIRSARERGIPVITGVEMFVQQGARQFEIWTGKPAPEEEMVRVVLHALRQRAEAPYTERGPQILPIRTAVAASAAAAPPAEPAHGSEDHQTSQSQEKQAVKKGAMALAKPSPPPKTNVNLRGPSKAPPESISSKKAEKPTQLLPKVTAGSRPVSRSSKSITESVPVKSAQKAKQAVIAAAPRATRVANGSATRSSERVAARNRAGSLALKNGTRPSSTLAQHKVKKTKEQAGKTSKSSAMPAARQKKPASKR